MLAGSNAVRLAPVWALDSGISSNTRSNTRHTFVPIILSFKVKLKKRKDLQQRRADRIPVFDRNEKVLGLGEKTVLEQLAGQWKAKRIVTDLLYHTK
jgi:CII-binding regulator of phage lambda lysogenization HflD